MKVLDLKYNFSKLNDSGNCTVRKTCYIVFDMKRNVSQMKLFLMARCVSIDLLVYNILISNMFMNTLKRIKKLLEP